MRILGQHVNLSERTDISQPLPALSDDLMLYKMVFRPVPMTVIAVVPLGSNKNKDNRSFRKRVAGFELFAQHLQD